MKKKYILALTFLCLLMGQNSYGQMNGGDLDEVCVGGGCDEEEDSNDPCDPWSSSYDFYICNGMDVDEDSGDPCDPTSISYDYDTCYGIEDDYCYYYPEVCYPDDPEPPTPESENPADPDPCESKLAAENKADLVPDDTQSSTANSLESASAIDDEEHGITFGRDANGSITQSPMRMDGGKYNVPVTQNWPGAFAAVHNHLVDYPPSAGDVYTAVTLITNNPNFATSYINMPNGDSYAIVVTNPTLAKEFVKEFPKDQIGNNPPEFPDTIFNQLQKLKSIMGSDTEGKLNAIVATLDKYNSGISFLKKDSGSNSYEKITIKQITTNGITTYQLVICP